MPYGSNPWGDINGATAGMQQSMANIALMQRQAQYRMQQQAAQQTLEQQRIGIERQAESRMGRATDSTIAYQGSEGRRADAETKKYGQEYDMARQTQETQGRIGRLRGYEGAPDPMSMIQDPFTGPQMMGDLRAANVVPQGQFQLTPQQITQALHSALGSQVYQQAVGTPASAERMTEPVQMGPSQIAFDPFSRQPMMQTGPAAPNPETVRHNTAMEGRQLTPEQRLILAQMHTAGTATARPHPNWETIDTDALNEVLTQAGNAFTGRTNTPSINVPHSSAPPSTNAPTPPTDDRGFFGRVFNTGPKQLKKPTKAQAMDYVKKYGVAGAHTQMKKDGYDTTDYAD